MKKTLIVANWKSHKNEAEANEWLQRFTIDDLRFTNKEIIICPPYTLLPYLKSYIVNHKSLIKLGAQNISPFGEGAYTGEVNGKQIKEFADHVIIGHSERRNFFSEDDTMLTQKVEMAKKHDLTPIFCIQSKDTVIPQGVKIVAYEPTFAIGTSHPDTPENADKIGAIVKRNNNISCVIYGGSVTSNNVKSFTEMPHIDGVLPGGASLDPREFLEIVLHA